VNNEENVADRNWFTNKQVLGLLGFSITMGIGYGEFTQMKANDKIQDLELEILKEEAAHEEQEMKGLIYTKAREGVEKTTRMVSPLREEVSELQEWMWTEKGRKDEREGK
jgi:hypothetical protein